MKVTFKQAQTCISCEAYDRQTDTQKLLPIEAPRQSLNMGQAFSPGFIVQS